MALAVTKRGVDELLVEAQKLARSAATGTPLRIKLGLDPTAPDIHIGHTVVLNKMRQLQDLGHTVIFLIGDFTSLIGDPSAATRRAPAAHARTDRIEREDLRAGRARARPRQDRNPLQQRMVDAARRGRDDARVALHGRADPRARGFHEALPGRRADLDPRIPVPADAGLRLGRAERRPRRRHRPEIQPAGRPRTAEAVWPGTAVHSHDAAPGLDGVEKMSKSKGNYVGISEQPNDMFG